MEAKREGKPNEEEGRIMSSRRKTSSAKAAAASAATKPAGRQPRSKTKKPKYLSLKLQLNHKTSPKPQIPIQPTNSYNEEKRMPPPPAVKVNVNLHQQLNLFSLHPEEDTQNPKCSEDEGRRHIDDEIHAAGDDHVAILLVSDAADTSTSLHGLLDSTTTTATDEDPSSPNYSLFRGESHGFGSSTETTSYDESSSWLVRAAMRCRERDPSEERWVSYCQVVEEQKKKKKKRKHKKTNIIRLDHDEVTSGDADPLGMMLIQQQKQSSRTKLVGLKLDYQEILDAWSDRGSLYIDHDDCDPQPPPQTVPDMQDSDDLPIGIVEDSGNVWRVPEMEEGGDKETSGEGGSNKEGYCWRQREASVLRYKEKRQNRLFSKRIRYQVRKLNAEKRPRLKGRFVKRVGE